MKKFALAFASFAITSPAAASLLVNGGFEQPDVATAVFLNSGSTAITGFTVANLPGGSIQLAHLDNAGFGSVGAVASEGSQFLELTGDVGRGAGVVSDPFASSAGATYDFSFDVGAFNIANFGSFGDATVDLYIDGTYRQSFTNIMQLSQVGTDWERFSYSFSGTGAAMRIGLFSSLSPTSSNLGVGLDGLELTQRLSGAVPEPSTWAMLVAGFGLVGAALRRRPALRRKLTARQARYALSNLARVREGCCGVT